MIFLKGNHEDMFLSYLGLPGKYGEMFLFNGGGATLASYGISPKNKTPEEILSLLPADHVEFLKSLRTWYLMDPFLCVHAGVQPLKPLSEQTETEIFWIRDEFIFNRHVLPYTVLFGHTPRREVFFHLCLEVTEKALFQIKRRGKTVTRKIVRDKWESADSPIP